MQENGTPKLSLTVLSVTKKVLLVGLSSLLLLGPVDSAFNMDANANDFSIAEREYLGLLLLL
jgi:hypothetical protein